MSIHSTMWKDPPGSTRALSLHLNPSLFPQQHQPSQHRCLLKSLRLNPQFELKG